MIRNLFALLLTLTLLQVDAQDRSISVDSDPFSLYLGNVIFGDSPAPAWQGPEGLKNGLDVGRYRVDKDDWIRYRLSLAYRKSTDRITVLALDNDLQPIEMRTAEDVVRQSSLLLSIGIEWEKVLGVKKLKGLLGRGIGIGTSRDFEEKRITNPLEAYLEDTLWTDTGYSGSLKLYCYTGVQYNPIEELSLSARINGGVFVDYISDEEIRVVSQEGSGAVLESMLNTVESSSWGLGFYFRPRIMMTFYF